MKGHIIKTDGQLEDVAFEGEPTLKAMQEIVGGNIELVKVLTDTDEVVHMIVNEEGLIHGLPFNVRATTHYHRALRRHLAKRDEPYFIHEHPPIVGNVLLLDGRLS